MYIACSCDAIWNSIIDGKNRWNIGSGTSGAGFSSFFFDEIWKQISYLENTISIMIRFLFFFQRDMESNYFFRKWKKKFLQFRIRLFYFCFDKIWNQISSSENAILIHLWRTLKWSLYIKTFQLKNQWRKDTYWDIRPYIYWDRHLS